MKYVALLVSCALVIACGGSSRAPAKPATGGGEVTQLRSIDQLRAAFNAHDGVPRLIVLASPT
jgi:hypothetical protein